MPSVFLSIPVQAARLPPLGYEALVDALDWLGCEIANPCVMQPPDAKETSRYCAREIFRDNLERLTKAQLLIAEISSPSLGVGYEISVAEQLGLPILCLYRRDVEARVSLMIRGIDYERLQIRAYDDPIHLAGFVHAALQAFGVAAGDDVAGASEYRSAVIEHFSRLAGSYDTTTEWRASPHMLAWFSRVIPSGASCLDIGTGTGLVGGHLQAHGRQVVGLDLVAGMLNQARGRLVARVRAHAEALPFAGACFDAVALRQTLHYLDDRRCLQEAYRVLAPEGVLACAQVAAPDAELACWWRALKTLAQPLRRRFYTEAALLRLVADAGFEMTAIEQLRLVRRDPWERFLVNCPGGEEGKRAVLSFLDNTPSRVAKRLELRRSAEGIAYIQHWALLQARRGGSVGER